MVSNPPAFMRSRSAKDGARLPFNRQIVEVFLERLGVRSTSVENGAQAVEAAALQAFDAILMDIQMPVMDGLAAIREIRRYEHAAHRSSAPIVVVSADSGPEDVAAAHAAGAQLHVAKPISLATVFAALSTACDPAQRHQRNDHKVVRQSTRHERADDSKPLMEGWQ